MWWTILIANLLQVLSLFTSHFADKPRVTCDILIGADGIKSSVRQLFLNRLPNPKKYERYLEPKWSGLVAYRGMVSKEALQKVLPGHRALEHPGLMVSECRRFSGTFDIQLTLMGPQYSGKDKASLVLYTPAPSY